MLLYGWPSLRLLRNSAKNLGKSDCCGSVVIGVSRFPSAFSPLASQSWRISYRHSSAGASMSSEVRDVEKPQAAPLPSFNQLTSFIGDKKTFSPLLRDLPQQDTSQTLSNTFK
jgi:hypothetical protein